MKNSSFQNHFISEVNNEIKKIDHLIDELWSKYESGEIDNETHRKMERPYTYNLIRLMTIKNQLEDLMDYKNNFYTNNQ